jgi:hypothetical protein
MTDQKVNTAARMLLERAKSGLLQALHADNADERYLTAHLAAVRAAAAVLATRSKPGSRGATRTAWELIPMFAPDLGEWASFFASMSTKRAKVEAGISDAVTEQMAADLLRDAEAFYHLVESSLGLPYEQVLPLDLHVGGVPR